jgi:hypothetical protein
MITALFTVGNVFIGQCGNYFGEFDTSTFPSATKHTRQPSLSITIFTAFLSHHEASSSK